MQVGELPKRVILVENAHGERVEIREFISHYRDETVYISSDHTVFGVTIIHMVEMK